MGQKEKLIQRLKTRPRDFTFEEAETLLRFLGYTRFDKGRHQRFPGSLCPGRLPAAAAP